MVDKHVPQERASHLTQFQQPGCFLQRSGERRCVCLISIAGHRSRRLEFLFDPKEPGRERGCDSEIRVGVRPRQPVFHTSGFRSWTSDRAQRCGAIVKAPGGIDGCPDARHQALVGIDGRAGESGHLPHELKLSRHVVLHHAGHFIRTRRVLEQVLGVVGVPEALVQVTAAAGQISVPLGHECGQQAAVSGDLFDGRLEKRGFIRSAYRRVVLDGGLINARARLGVKAFQLDVEGAQGVKDGMGQFGKSARAQDAVPEHPGGEGLHPPVVFLPHAVCVLFEQEELELCRDHGLITHSLRLGDDALQQLTRRNRQRMTSVVIEIEYEEGGPRLPGDDAEGREIDLGQHVGVASVPTGYLRVVIKRVGRVPAEDHVAEPQSAFRRGVELVTMDVFAAQNAVDIESADLDLGDVVLGKQVFDGF